MALGGEQPRADSAPSWAPTLSGWGLGALGPGASQVLSLPPRCQVPVSRPCPPAGLWLIY